jgi:hypothetical protein
MGGGFIGGDGSVRWELFGDNVGSRHQSTANGPRGRRHVGIDTTADGGQFLVTLRLPAKPDPTSPPGFLRYTMPIVADTWDQIRIDWTSVADASTARKGKTRRKKKGKKKRRAKGGK